MAELPEQPDRGDGAAGLDAINFGPGAPAQAHRRDESVAIDALVRSYRVLEAFAA